jgi:hypothetical protein
MKKLLFGFIILLPFFALAQSSKNVSSSYWQQRVKYDMNVDVNAEANQFTGTQKLEYWNNSPDTLTKVYYHLYWNAFQPGSMMDERSRRQGTQTNARGSADWDGRVKDRISKLSPSEIGYQKILSLKMNGRPQSFKILETILEVKLDKTILPRTKVVFDLEFEAQVPVQIRRSGRDNAEGVRFSMSQWYPKLCEYDKDGWHPTPYIAREFYGVWGDYDVKISIDKNYILAGTGYLQNPNEIGYGYETKAGKFLRSSGNKLTWKFSAPNVHDFVWAADVDYIHNTKTVRDGLVLHSFYKIDPELLKKQYNGFSDKRKKEEFENNADNFVAFYKQQWEEILDIAALVLPYIDKTFGKYPYKQYSFIQGGDGGMEYPMATLIKGAGPDLFIHEWMHSWYQGMLATNESMYAWMDEGLTNYAEARITANFTKDTGFAQTDNYAGYFALAKSGKEEPLATHADHFNTNYAYSSAAYLKGSVFIEQLGYIIGAQTRDKVLLEYYNQWRFKHPDVNDFIRLAEKTSSIKLDWYKEYWVNTTKTVDYGIDSLWSAGDATNIRLKNTGMIPMPVDVKISFKDGSSEWHYIPMYLMFGEKKAEEGQESRKVYDAWKWTHPTYQISTNRKLTDIVSVEIDPSKRMADVNKKDNKLELKW